MIESGLVEYWKKKLSISGRCSQQFNVVQQTTPRILSLNDMYSLFIIWFIGVSLASIAFLLENCVHMVRKCIVR